MKSYDDLRLDSLRRIQNLCDIYAIALALILEYPPLRALLDAIVTKIEIAKSINLQNITNFTTKKEVTCITMVETVYKFMLRGALKAAELNLPDLEKSLTIAKSLIMRYSDSGIATKCEEFKNILKTNIAILVNILPADITLMEDAIKAYKLALDAPKEAIDKRKNFGTAAISRLLNQADPTKTNIGRVFHSYFDPDVAAAFDVAAHIGKPSNRRKTSIAIRFVDADSGIPVIKVKTKVIKDTITFEKLSSKTGWIHYYSLEVGTWSATYENNMYLGGTIINIPVDLKKVARYTIKLQKKVPVDGGGTTPVVTGYANVYGKMYNSVTLDGIGTGLVFFQNVADPEETEDDGTYGNDHTPANCKHISGTAPGFQDFHKDISLEPDSDNEIDLPMDPIDDGPTPPDA